MNSILIILLTLLVPLVAPAQDTGLPALSDSTNKRVDVGGYRIWVGVKGAGKVTVVFESGNGNDSSEWGQIAPRIRAAGARTFVYDRAGLGRSEQGTTPYSIDDEVRSLRSALTFCGIEGPIILVSHSYGGFISLLTASMDKRVAGMVLVDAAIPSFFNKTEVAAILAEYRPQYDKLRQQAPALAKTIIPLMEAYPATARRLRATRIPKSLPTIDILAEHSWLNSPESAVAWRMLNSWLITVIGNRFSLLVATTISCVTSQTSLSMQYRG